MIPRKKNRRNKFSAGGRNLNSQTSNRRIRRCLGKFPRHHTHPGCPHTEFQGREKWRGKNTRDPNVIFGHFGSQSIKRDMACAIKEMGIVERLTSREKNGLLMQHALYHFSLPIFSSSFPFPFCAWKEWLGEEEEGGEEECALIDASAKKIKKFVKKGRVFPVKLICETLAGFLFFLFIWQCLCRIVGFHAIFKSKRKPISWIWRVWFSLANRKRGGALISISCEIIIWEKGWVRWRKGNGGKIPFRSGGTLMVLFRPAGKN